MVVLLYIFLALIALFAGLVFIGVLHAHVRRKRLEHGGGDLSEYKRAQRGEGKRVAELARVLGVPEDTLLHFQPVYRQVAIPKRSGGQRYLQIPDETTKRMQRRVLHRLLGQLRVHEAATGFEKGRSIADNALPHVGQAVVIKMDIADFFTSTTAERVEWWFRRIGWNANAAEILAKITTHDGGLPQGAPTSPKLSNLVNFYLDVQLTNLAERRKGCYTRYADDITFSFPLDYPRKVRGIVQRTKRIVKSKGYTMHTRGKLRVLRQHQQQRVTGLVVNKKVAIPRRTRRWLRAVEHRLKTGRDATLTPEQFAGWQALRVMVDASNSPAKLVENIMK